jgi:hypothetical protein
MATLEIPEELFAKLRAIAERDNRSVTDLLKSWIESHDLPESQSDEDGVDDPFAAIDGMFDDDITDMSTSVRETLEKYTHPQYDGLNVTTNSNF